MSIVVLGSAVLLATIFASFLLTPTQDRRVSFQIALPLVFCFLGAGILAFQLFAPGLSSAMPLV
jgi:hypothetical protein